MTNEQLNTRLYEKMAAEQARYRAWLLTQPPEEILNHTCEYTTREDILIAISDAKLTAAQTRALLRSSSPLDDVYREWSKTDTNHMDDIRDIIEARAGRAVQLEKERAREAR